MTLDGLGPFEHRARGALEAVDRIERAGRGRVEQLVARRRAEQPERQLGRDLVAVERRARRPELRAVQELRRLQHRADDQGGPVREARAVERLAQREDALVLRLLVGRQRAAERAPPERPHEACRVRAGVEPRQRVGRAGRERRGLLGGRLEVELGLRVDVEALLVVGEIRRGAPSRPASRSPAPGWRAPRSAGRPSPRAPTARSSAAASACRWATRRGGSRRTSRAGPPAAGTGGPPALAPPTGPPPRLAAGAPGSGPGGPAGVSGRPADLAAVCALLRRSTAARRHEARDGRERDRETETARKTDHRPLAIPSARCPDHGNQGVIPSVHMVESEANHPAFGEAVRPRDELQGGAAGVDVTLIDEMLRLTPRQRLEQNDRMATLAVRLRKAFEGRGGSPGWTSLGS